MILSVSRRTDIPAFYSEWFFNRLKEGYVDVRNPMNAHMVSRVALSPEITDCIVFWSKNPAPMVGRLNELKDYRYYFQFTINPYSQEIEPHVPRKSKIIDTFKALSDAIGPDRVIWRYDPIAFSKDITVDYHIKYFEELAKKLEGHTDKCVISFLDVYSKIKGRIAGKGIYGGDDAENHAVSENISWIAKAYGMRMESCAESDDLDRMGIRHGCCISKELIGKICGYPIKVKKDKNQRSECGCVESIDIGAYNTCSHECAYCYANFSEKSILSQIATHDPNSSLLIGHAQESDVIKPRHAVSHRSEELF